MAGKLLLFLALGTAFSGSLYADHTGRPLRGSHFFLPSRTTFFFQPHYYFLGSVIPPVWHPGFRFSRRHYVPRHDAISSYAPRTFGVYQVIVDSPRGELVRANTADLVFNVEPSEALVYVDGKLIGSARGFASERDRYTIVSGAHDLRIEFPGYEPFQAQLEVTPDRTIHLDIELQTKPRP